MLTVAFVVSILVQVVLPVFLGFYFVRRFNSEWKVFGVGALAFLTAQILQTPLFQTLSETEFYPAIMNNWVSTYVIILFGFLSALIENAARFGGFWLIREKAKAFGSSLVMGAGHGGIESLMVGVQFLINFIFAISISTSGTASMELSAEEAAALSKQVEAFWTLPWYLPLASALQRLSALSLQIVLSVMMWIAVSRRMWLFALAALLWHTAMNALAATISYAMPNMWNSLLLVGVLMINVAVTFLLYSKAKATGPMEAPEPAKVKGLSFLERERAQVEPQQKTASAADYRDVIEAKRARQKQLKDGETGDKNQDEI